jgi:predicted metal-dependent HD superfamily phosphohydrolase
LEEKELEILQIAAWFHDTGYYRSPEKHEELSANLAEAFLKEQSFPEEDIKTVKRCIMATRLPQQPADMLEAIICDADLSHLGNEHYWDRCGRLRQEMNVARDVIMSETEWVEFEINFMRRHSYHTDVAQRLFEKRKNKHIKQLQKQKVRLDPDALEAIEEAKAEGKKKKKKKKKGKGSDLKELNLGRGVETMYRTTYRTHVNLSSIADNKANIMLSINAIIISIVVTNLVPRFGQTPWVVWPTAILLAVCLGALVFAIMATRPKVTEGRVTRDDIESKRSNLLFFGNFYNMDLEDFHWGMMEMIKDSDFLYSSMTRDLYFLGIVLAKKYRFLRICYGIFMYGLIGSVAFFGLAYYLTHSG